MKEMLAEAMGDVKPYMLDLHEAIGAQLFDSATPYVGRGNLCTANNDTCGARRMADSPYCVGHTRQLAPDIWAKRTSDRQ